MPHKSFNTFSKFVHTSLVVDQNFHIDKKIINIKIVYMSSFTKYLKMRSKTLKHKYIERKSEKKA